jgi:hypothetical protein
MLEMNKQNVSDINRIGAISFFIYIFPSPDFTISCHLSMQGDGEWSSPERSDSHPLCEGDCHLV